MNGYFYAYLLSDGKYTLAVFCAFTGVPAYDNIWFAAAFCYGCSYCGKGLYRYRHVDRCSLKSFGRRGVLMNSGIYIGHFFSPFDYDREFYLSI